MPLLEFLYQRRITQMDLHRATLKLGAAIWPADLSKIVNGKIWTIGYANRLRDALSSLGVTAADLDQIDELKPRD